MTKNQSFGLLLICLVTFGSFATGCGRSLQKQASNNDLYQLVNRLESTDSPTSGKSSDVRFAPAQECMVCIKTAGAVAKAGHLKEAIRLYEKAQTLSPKDSSITRQLAPLYAQAGDFDRSINAYHELMRTDGRDPEFLNNFAWTLMEGNQLEQAKALASNSLQSFPDSRNLASTLAVIYYRLGNRESAFKLFSKVYGEHAAHHNLAVLDVDSRNEAPAKTHLEKAMRLKDNPLTAQLSKAIVESRSTTAQ